MFKVLHILVDKDGNQIGASVFLGGTDIRDIPYEDLWLFYKGRLSNAIVTTKGLRGKPGVHLKKKLYKHGFNGDYKQTTVRDLFDGGVLYTLMHCNKVVLKVYDWGVSVVTQQKLPFDLRGIKLTVSEFKSWLRRRVDHLTRVYMSEVYVVRSVGRDFEKILLDSRALSVTDNFWVKRTGDHITWEGLISNRDKDKNLAKVALTGVINDNTFNVMVDSTTSLYAVKGAFPKAILGNTMLKKDFDAEKDVLVTKIGNYIGVETAQSTFIGEGYVSSELFTSYKKSLVHASELLHLTDYSVDVKDDEHRAIYDYAKRKKRVDLVNGLERLFLLSYIIYNRDLHGENFGFLYDSDTFKILGVAPAYDFNNSFLSFHEIPYYSWILSNLGRFVHNNKDIIAKIDSIEFMRFIASLKMLSPEQEDGLFSRVADLSKL